MADQRVNYESGSTLTGDSGARYSTGGADSIKPYTDGERAAASVFVRPPENLRNRTEVDRQELEALKYLSDTNIKWLISGTTGALGSPIPLITMWDHTTGLLQFADDIYIQPAVTPDVDKGTVHTWTFDDGVTSPAATLIFTGRLPAAKGGDTPEIRLTYDTVNSGVCTLTPIGDPSNIFEILVSDDGSVLVSTLVSLLLASGDFGITYTIASGGNLNTAITSSGPSYPTAQTYDSLGTYEREMHLLQPSTWNPWNAINPIADGDTVGIYFSELTDLTDWFNPAATTAVGRRQKYGASVGVVAPDLFLSSVEPEKLPLCIPLCKRVGDDLFFLDGTVVKGEAGSLTTPIYFGEHAYTIDRIVGGSTIIVMNAYTDASPLTLNPIGILATDTLQDFAENAVDAINSKPDLDLAEVVTGNWTFEGTYGYWTTPITSVLEYTNVPAFNAAAYSAFTAKSTIITADSYTTLDLTGGEYVVQGNEPTGALGILTGISGTADLLQGDATNMYGGAFSAEAGPLSALGSGSLLGPKIVGLKSSAVQATATVTALQDVIGLHVETDVSGGAPTGSNHSYVALFESATNVDYGIYQSGALNLGNVLESPLGIGTDPAELLHVAGTTMVTAQVDAYSNSATDTSLLTLQRSRGTTVGTLTTTSDGDALGIVRFKGVDATTAAATAAAIEVTQVGTAGAAGVAASLEMIAYDNAGSVDGTATLRGNSLQSGGWTQKGGVLGANGPAGDVGLTVHNYTALSNQPAVIQVGHSANGIIGSLTAATTGDDLAQIQFSGVNSGGSGFVTAARITVTQGTATGLVATSGNMVLETANSTATGLNSDQLVLAESGHVGVGITTPLTTLHVAGSVATDYVTETVGTGSPLTDYDVTGRSVLHITAPTNPGDVQSFTNGVAGQIIYIYNDSANQVDLLDQHGGTQDIYSPSGNIELMQYEGVTLVCDGSGWYLVGFSKP